MLLRNCIAEAVQSLSHISLRQNQNLRIVLIIFHNFFKFFFVVFLWIYSEISTTANEKCSEKLNWLPQQISMRKKRAGKLFHYSIFLFRLRERKWTTERANGTIVYCVSVYHNWVMLILDKFYELLFIFTFHSTFCFTLDDSLIGNTSLCLILFWFYSSSKINFILLTFSSLSFLSIHFENKMAVIGIVALCNTKEYNKPSGIQLIVLVSLWVVSRRRNSRM